MIQYAGPVYDTSEFATAYYFKLCNSLDIDKEILCFMCSGNLQMNVGVGPLHNPVCCVLGMSTLNGSYTLCSNAYLEL